MKTWKKWLKRIAATVCAAAMCAAMLPATAFAAEEAKITSFSLERVIEVPDEVPETAIEGVNYEPTPEIPENGQVTLLYKVTVNADAEAPFKVEFDGGSRIYTSEAAIADNTFVLLDGSGTVTQYYIKNFTAEDVEDTKLNATATVEGATAYGMTGTLAEGVEASQTVSVAVVGESAEPEPEPEPRYTITGFTKERVTGNRPNDAVFDLDGYTINYDDGTIDFTENESVTLLYKLTVTGDEDACYNIEDQGASLVGWTEPTKPAAIDGTFVGEIPANGKAYFYVAKTFTAEAVVDRQLTNIATIEGLLEDSVLSDDLDTDSDGKYTVTETTPATAPETGEGDDEEKVSKPGLEKWIVTDNGDKVEMDDVAAGTTVKFELDSNVPDDLRNYITVDDPAIKAAPGEYKLTFADRLDDEFDDPQNLQVKIGNTVLTADQYELMNDDTHNFLVTLDLVKLYEAGVITPDDVTKATPITVTYTATLREGTTAGVYTNSAQVAYPDGQSSSDTVMVRTYAIKVFKYDQVTNAGLPGAQFALYQKDDEGNITNSQSLTSDADGYVRIDGLDAGTYYLKEAVAPDGYMRSEKELTIEVNYTTSGADYTVEAQFANIQIPHTGGTGTMMYTIGGIAIIALAGALLFVYRKNRKEDR